ncbi:hypothetical protein ACQKM2_15350 [Streptomyces sp. NPDC004126]
MNLDIAATAVIAAAEDLVIEDFCGPAAEAYQPGTCICWTGDVSAE